MIEREKFKPVSVIGLGNMGSALAQSLLSNNQSIVVWNRTAEKCEALAVAGARVAASIAEAGAEVTVLCVADHQASISLLQSDELVRALRGKLLIQLSTITADESRALGRWAEERGVDYLDGTIYCYPASILAGQGTIYYSGPKALFDANEELLTAMGGDPKFLSEEIGAAPTFDKTLYSFHYGSIVCFLHGAALSKAAGIPLADYFELAISSKAATKTVERMARMVEARTYGSDTCAIKVEMAAYDHVLKLSETLGIESELPRLMAKIMERACQAGYADQDLAAVFEVLLDPVKGD
jgi:3-hydroxyisobutyrate dehydrogenase-like beta-hydroxyacid dehydrogenase